MTMDCRLEKARKDEILSYIAHHPDGGFRRFRIDPDGGGLVPADGADEARTVIEADLIEVMVGQDRYRIPAGMVDHDDRP